MATKEPTALDIYARASRLGDDRQRPVEGQVQDCTGRVAELDRVPPATVRRALDAPSRIGNAQRPARKDQPTSIKDSPVCLSPALVGLKDEFGALLRIAEKPPPKRPECVF